MFTGIIEETGVISEAIRTGSNIDFWIEAGMASELRKDQSIAHNGVCLTVVEIVSNKYKVTAVEETLKKTNLGICEAGDLINLERCLKVGDRLDGHFVQGHVDSVAVCIGKEEQDGSWLCTFRFHKQFAPLVIEKGSACVNGVSLTVFNVTLTSFTVTIIPHTYEHTNFSRIKDGSMVNIEFDVMGKYLLRQKQLMGR